MTARRQGVSCLLTPFLGPSYSPKHTSLFFKFAVRMVLSVCPFGAEVPRFTCVRRGWFCTVVTSSRSVISFGHSSPGRRIQWLLLKWKRSVLPALNGFLFECFRSAPFPNRSSTHSLEDTKVSQSLQMWAWIDAQSQFHFLPCSHSSFADGCYCEDCLSETNLNAKLYTFQLPSYHLIARQRRTWWEIASIYPTKLLSNVWRTYMSYLECYRMVSWQRVKRWNHKSSKSFCTPCRDVDMGQSCIA